MKSLFIAALSALIGFLPLVGQETLVLKDGSRFIGHISRESIPERKITFKFDSAVVVEKISNVEIGGDPYLHRLDNLTENWRNWFAKNPTRIINDKGSKMVYLGEISCNDPGRRELNGDAVILERGDSTVTFFSANRGEITIDKRDMLDHIEYAPRDILSLYGTIEEVITSSGFPMRGQLLADYPDRLVLLTDDGVRNVIPYNRIKSRRTLPYNVNAPLPRQVRFLSNITLNDRSNPIVGVIEERNYKTPETPKPYYEVRDSTGRSTTKVYFKDIASISVIKQNAFNNEKDVVINNDGDLIVRDNAGYRVAPRVLCIDTDEGKEIADTTGIVTVSFSDLKDGMLKICYRDTPVNSTFTLTEMKKCPPSPVVEGKAKNWFKKTDDDTADAAEPLYRVSYRDIYDNSFMPYDRTVSPAGNISVNYGPVIPGNVYLLIRKADKASYLIKIEP